jgi:hypothetical protein
MTLSGRPRFTGAKLYNHPQQLFSFWYPSDWSILQWDENARQLAVSPRVDDLGTSFIIEVRDLGTPVTQDDRPLLREGIEAGLAELTDYACLEFTTFEDALRFGFDMLYTFSIDGQTRKRHSVIYYRDHWQYSLNCQGATEADYHYWLPMLNFILMTCQGTSFSAFEWGEQANERLEKNT